MNPSAELTEIVNNLFAILAVSVVYLFIKSLINKEQNEVYAELLQDIQRCEDVTDCIFVEFQITKLKFLLTRKEYRALQQHLTTQKVKIAERTGLRMSLSQ